MVKEELHLVTQRVKKVQQQRENVPQARRKSKPNTKTKGGLDRWFKENWVDVRLVNLVVAKKERKEDILPVVLANVYQVRHLRQQKR